MQDTKLMFPPIIIVGPIQNLWSLLEIYFGRNVKIQIFLQNYKFLFEEPIFLFLKYDNKNFILHHCQCNRKNVKLYLIHKLFLQ